MTTMNLLPQKTQHRCCRFHQEDGGANQKLGIIHSSMRHLNTSQNMSRKNVYSTMLLGFSQGGTLATALAVSGILGPNLRAVVTAGAPYNQQVFQFALELQSASPNDVVNGFDNVPKLHFAGLTDALVSIESTSELCRSGGGGKLILHDQGHLFPTRSARVKEILDFLDVALSRKDS
jgi:predicted esterase